MITNYACGFPHFDACCIRAVLRYCRLHQLYYNIFHSNSHVSWGLNWVHSAHQFFSLFVHTEREGAGWGEIQTATGRDCCVRRLILCIYCCTITPKRWIYIQIHCNRIFRHIACALDRTQNLFHSIWNTKLLQDSSTRHWLIFLRLCTPNRLKAATLAMQPSNHD